MKLSETGKSLIRKILSTAVFLCLINDGRVEYDGDADGNLPTFSGEELRITIGFRNDMYNANGLPEGSAMNWRRILQNTRTRRRG